MTDDRIRIGKPAFALAVLAGATIAILPTCRSTEHTVARIVTPTPGPVEVFVPEPRVPAATPAEVPPTSTPAAVRTPTPSPTVVGMPVQTPSSTYDRSPGVLYEELVPTAAAVTPIETPAATRTRTPRPTRTPTSGPTRRPGVYYEDPEGRPVPTGTPSR